MATETLLPRDDEDLGPSCATATSGTSGAPGPVPKVYTVCTSCNEQIIAGGAEQREHYRSERHMYNVKRKLEGAAPIPAEVWERKLQRFREIQQEQAKKTDHLKKGGNKKAGGSSAPKVESHIKREKSGETTATSREDHESDSARPAVEQAAVDQHALPPHRRCLFDHRSFKSLEDNLEYMKSKYSFTIPDKQYCSDKEGLLEFLHLKISKGHQCLYCDRAFKSAADCRQHMLDKNHTRIGLEGYTRTGNYSEELTLELKAQLEQFYDYRSSWKELNLSAKGKAKEEMRFQLENIAEAAAASSASAAGGKKEMTDAEKLAEMFDFFDEDEDGLLDFEEARDFAELILPPESADSFDELAYQKLAEESQRASPNPDRENSANAEQDSFGVDLQTFARHFFSTGKYSSIAATHGVFLDEYDIVEDGEDSVMDASTSHLSTSDTEFRVCENEDDFQRVCKALNLRVARVNEETGNLQLPDGSEAAHRGLRYVYRQRGLHLYAGRRERTSAEKAKQKAIGGGFGARLALQNGGANCLVGISELKKQGKQIMAIQRKDMKKFMRQGIQQTILNRGRTITAMGYVR